MKLKNLLIVVICLCLILLETGCAASKKTIAMNELAREENTSIHNLFDFETVAVGYVNSGTYGGSIQNEAFPTEHNYSKFSSSKVSDSLKRLFDNAMNSFLDNTTVNGIVTVREYIGFLLSSNAKKLEEIHNQEIPPRATGNRIQNLPILLFGKNEVLKVELSQISLSIKGVGINDLFTFLKENGTHFSSIIPDEFYEKHYKGKF